MWHPKRIDNREPISRTENLTRPGKAKAEVMTLVDEAANGNFSAFGQLYEMFLDKIYRYAYYQVKDRMTAEDITEAVFVKAWKQIATCKGRGATFSSWLYRIAHNQTVDTLKSHKAIQTIDLEDISNLDSPDFNVDMRDEAEELAGLIAELPAGQRQVLILKFIEGLNNTEISHILNKSERAIRVLQMRALSRMREKLRQGQVEQ